MPVSKVLNRDEFVEWVGGRGLPRASQGVEVRSRWSSQDIMIIWPEQAGPPSNSNVPIVTLPISMMREFFAFTGTYVSTYAPFSAFFRVVPYEYVDDVLDAHVFSRSRRIPEEIVAVSIAEAFLQTGGTRSLREIGVQAGLATVSSGFIAALRHGYSQRLIAQIPASWSKARDTFVGEGLRISVEHVAGFWTPLFGMFSEHSTAQYVGRARSVLRFIEARVEHGLDLDPLSWRDLTSGFPEVLRSFDVERSVSREEQVRRIDLVRELLLDAPGVDPMVREVAAGFLLARVAQGSLEYISLCEPFVERLPRAVLWFAFFTAFAKNNNVLSVADCLGRRISRDLFSWSGLFSSPVADIGFYELDAHRNGASLNNMLFEQQSVAMVELLPGVTARYKFSRGRPESADRQLPNAAALMSEEVRALRSALKNAIYALDATFIEQTDLFPSRPNGARGDKKKVRRQ